MRRTFHIRYVQPLHVEQLFNILALYDDENLTLDRIMEIANEMEYEIRINQDLLFELFHFFFYSIWSISNSSDNMFSWTYSQICTYLWNNISCRIDVKNIASQLERTIIDNFPDESPSIGPDTVRAALAWLNPLKISCLSESEGKLTFTRRPFCPPELMIMVIGFLYREKGIPYASNMLLTEENIDELCCACLLDPDAFDEVLNWATRQFDFLKSSMSGGGWGRHLTLLRKPELSDLI